MNLSIQAWIIDMYAMGSVLLVAASLAVRCLSQPAIRMAVCRAAFAGTLALAVIAALPGWPRFSCRSAPVPPVSPPSAPPTDAYPSIASSSITQRSQGRPPQLPSEPPQIAVAPASPAPLANGRAVAPIVHTAGSWQPAWTTALVCGSLAGLWVCLGGLLTALAMRGMREAPESLQQLLSRVVPEGARTPDLRISPRIGQPMALSVLRPTIVLPEALTVGEPEYRIEAILAHEWAHIRNGDLWLLGLLRLLLPLWFAHPAYWWLRRQVRADQEALADVAATRGEDPIAYAEILLYWARTVSSQPRQAFAGAVALWERPSQLRRRIAMLLDREHRVEKTCPRTWRLGVPGFTVASVLALSVLSFRPMPRAVADTPKAQADAAAKSSAKIVLHGRVFSPDDKPVAGATVTVLLTPRSQEPKTVSATTDTEGRYQAAVPKEDFEAVIASGPWASITVVATAPSLGPDWSSIREPVDGELDLRLVRDDVPIEGRLLDLEGRPVAGATVRRGTISAEAGDNIDPYLKLVATDPFLASNHGFAKYLGGSLPLPGLAASTTTDDAGRFRFTGIGRNRIVDLSFDAPAIQSATVRVMTRDVRSVASKPGEFAGITVYGSRFDFLVPPGRALTGIVRDKITRQPIARVSVSGSENHNRTFTDAEGRYTLSGFAKSDSYRLMVNAGDRSPYFVTCLRVPDTAGLAPIVADVDCEPGIPLRLKLVDKETGQPVMGAEVFYEPIYPNPNVDEHSGYAPVNGAGPFNSAVQEPDGTYSLGVLPGPGGVFVRTSEGVYRPAQVDPKAFFRDAPGGTDGMRYGDRDSLYMAVGTGFGGMPQSQFSGILLTNPTKGSGPLTAELALERDHALEVRTVDEEGNLVEGVTADGAKAADRPGTLRVFKLNPRRPRRVVFRQNEKKLVGFMLARGDEAQPYTITLKPWGTLVGRLVDAQGKPRPGVDLMTNNWNEIIDDPTYAILGGLKTDEEGRFRIEALVPGQKLSASAVGRKAMEGGYGIVIDEVILKPGELRDLGDVQSREEPIKEAAQ